MAGNLPKVLITTVTLGLVSIFLFGVWGIFSSFEIGTQYCVSSLVMCSFSGWALGAEIAGIASIGIVLTIASGMKWFGMFHLTKEL
ncbi:MAG: hypothetical protein OK457_00910 [Thaumarchaeota archaeon]|nr:hypothetical protein [Nitrososphaerota archaeon]